MKKTFIYSAISQAVLLAIALPAIALPAIANTSENKTEALDAIEVSADASQDGLSKEFAGGQVAEGSRAGILGNRANLENPFSSTAYTNKLIQDQQARSVADVLKNDPTVRTARGYGNFQEAYFMRGFITTSDDTLYNGLYGLLPRQYIASEIFERVEVQRGASAFLNGMAPGGGSIGGTIALMPKRAGNEDLNRFTIGTTDKGRNDLGADLSRRFGENKEFGVRLNAAHHEGKTGVDGERVHTDVFHLGLDWKGERTRVSADLGYQYNKLSGTRPSVTLSGVTSVPDAAKASSNWAQPWTYSKEEDFFGTVRGEYDIAKNWTTYAAYGFRYGKESNSLANLYVTNVNGDGYEYRFDNTRRNYIHTGEVGIKGKFETGAVEHDVVLAVNRYQEKRKNAYVMDWGNNLYTNLYSPSYYSIPSTANALFKGGDLSNPKVTARTTLTSIALGDTLSFLEKSLQVTLGVRGQKIDSKGYEYGTEVQNTHYKKTRLSPSVGIVYRLTPEVSVYGNYIESLSQGNSAPTGSKNAGQILKPYVSKQKEIGAKYESNGLGLGVALFSTDKPRGYLDSNNYYTTKGKDRHNGMELTAYGQLADNLRLLGGLTFLHAKQRDTGSSNTDGKYTIGVPKFQANAGVEWDLKAIDGLTLDTRVTYTGSSYVDSANTLKAKRWVKWDLGTRYIAVVNNTPVTLRLNLDNVTNKKYWASTGGYENYGYLVAGTPRTLTLSATIDF